MAESYDYAVTHQGIGPADPSLGHPTQMAVFDRGERSTDAISHGGCKCLTIQRSDFELLLDFNRELAYKVLWSCVRLLSGRLRSTNDSLRSFLAMSMF